MPWQRRMTVRLITLSGHVIPVAIVTDTCRDQRAHMVTYSHCYSDRCGADDLHVRYVRDLPCNFNIAFFRSVA